MLLRLTSVAFATVFIFTACNTNKNTPESGKNAEQGLAIDTNAKVAVSPQEQRIQKLEFNFTPGETIRYKMEQKDEIVQDDSIRVVNNTTLFYTKHIVSNKDGVVNFTITYDSIKVHQKAPSMGTMPANEIKFNSTDSSSKGNKDYAVFNSIIGNPVTITMNSKGRIEEISGMTPIINAMLKYSPTPNNVSEQQRTQIAEQIKVGMYAQIIQQEQITLPDSTLDSTMSWSRTSPQEIPPFFISNSTIRYNIGNVSKIEDHKVADVTATLSGNIELVKTKQPIPVTLKSSSMSGSGKTFIDVDRGYTLLKDTKIMLSIVAESVNPKTKKTEQMKQTKTTIMHVEKLK